MRARFRWEEWNRDHIGRHGVSSAEAEYVVTHASAPYPRPTGDRKFLVRGQTRDGRFLQVIYAVDHPEDFQYERLDLIDMLELLEQQMPRFFIIHARELTPREKSSRRRRR